MREIFLNNKGGAGGGFLTPKQMKKYKSLVQQGHGIEFLNKDQALYFIRNKFGDFPQV